MLTQFLEKICFAQNGWEDLPSSGGGSGSNASVGTNGTSAPGSSTQIAGVNPSGSLQPIQTNAAGAVKVELDADIVIAGVNVADVGGNPVDLGVGTAGSATQRVALDTASTVGVSSSVLPTGASTSALQSTGNTSLASIAAGTPTSLGQKVMAASSSVTIASDQSNVPVNLGQVGGSAVSIGQQLAAASIPAVLPAAQITALTPPTTVTVIQPTGTSLHTVVDASALPSGASTSAFQSNVQSAPGTPQTVAITIQGNASGVAVPISAAALPLPAGAALDSHLTNVQSAPGTPQTVALTIQGNASGVPMPVTTQALPAAFYSGQQTSTGTAVAIAGSQALANGVIVQALATNAGNVYVGPSGVTAASGFQLQPGQATSVGVANLNAVFLISSSSGDGICYVGS